MIKDTNALIIKALKNAKNPVVAYSGGKDSETVLYLVRKKKPDILAIWCNHGVAHPETVTHCRSVPNLIELHPKKNFWQCQKEYDFPVMKSKAKSHGNRCCYWLKEEPMIRYIKENNVDLVFTGLTQDESDNRWLFFKRLGPYYYMKGWATWKCHPIWDWSEKTVWEFIKDNNIK